MSLRRRAPLGRGSAPRTDPAKALQWQRRSREAARERLKERAPRPQGRRKARVPPEVRERVLARTGGSCVRPGCGRRAVHLHHWLTEERFPELALDEDNLSGTCPQCNWDHHWRPHGRLPFAAVPSRALVLAVSRGGEAVEYVLRYYPHAEATPRGPGPAEPGDE